MVKQTTFFGILTRTFYLFYHQANSTSTFTAKLEEDSPKFGLGNVDKWQLYINFLKLFYIKRCRFFAENPRRVDKSIATTGDVEQTAGDCNVGAISSRAAGKPDHVLDHPEKADRIVPGLGDQHHHGSITKPEPDHERV